VEQGVGIGRAAGNVNVHRDDAVHPSAYRVIAAEDAAATATRAHGHDKPRRRHGVVGFAQSQFHVARHRSCHEQHVGVARGGGEVNAEAFNVIDRTVQPGDFHFTAVAGAGVHFANVEGASE